MKISRLLPWTGLLLVTAAISSHDDSFGARYVNMDGANASNCLEHHQACASIRWALSQAQPGNTVKVAAGIYDVSTLDPESFLFGSIKAAGGYRESEHYLDPDPDRNPTIIYGLDARYRLAAMRQGFKWAADRASAGMGIIDSSPALSLQATQAVPIACVQGSAGQFPCRNIDFAAQIPLNQFASAPVSAGNVWGFVDLNDNREYAVIGLSNSTSVVEVTNPDFPRQVGHVSGNQSSWREVKLYQHFDAGANRYRAYAYVTTEAGGSGMQVIDLSGLPNSIALARTLTDTLTQHTNYVSNIDYATNVALPGAQATMYLNGSRPGVGAWRAYSLANPAQPVFVGAATGAAQYVHDSASMLITDQRTTQCDQGHNPCEVLIDFNENTVDLWDVTVKSAPVRLSSTGYSNATYTHSGWPSSDQRHVFIHDELEEIRQGLNTQIYTMNLDDLRNPFIVTSYQGPNTTTDHNGYTKGNLYYVSHYRRGVVVFDVSNPSQLREVGHFDTFLSPGSNSAGTDGAWGVYPFLPSGTIVVSDISNGLFVLRDRTASLALSAGRIGFALSSVAVGEAAVSAQVRVQRVAGTAGAVSVQFATADGSATAGSDYTATSGTLSWADGDFSDRTVTIALVNDTQVETAETFQLALSAPTGGATIDGATSLTVSIQDNDAVAPAARGGGGALGGELMLLGGLWWLGSRRKAYAQRRSH